MKIEYSSIARAPAETGGRRDAISLERSTGRRCRRSVRRGSSGGKRRLEPHRQGVVAAELLDTTNYDEGTAGVFNGTLGIDTASTEPQPLMYTPTRVRTSTTTSTISPAP